MLKMRTVMITLSVTKTRALQFSAVVHTKRMTIILLIWNCGIEIKISCSV